MNHDYAHCLDFKRTCPKECFRAQLVRDLYEHPFSEKIVVSWAKLKGTKECPLKGEKDDQRRSC